ncbi:hypothetical protein A8C56_05095 [Niabella ginsenosidivorans]|uniref:NodB homology domain-containing protein n=1 Tax=Niabella ginsenosidivorans TaxID=1176587 RepID=A0A1A9I051_9BACT|nr:hypothetical protein A8C56_05095 [Niabella ginsenosidivorans]
MLGLVVITFSFCAESCQKGENHGQLTPGSYNLPPEDSSTTNKTDTSHHDNTSPEPLDPTKMSFEVVFSNTADDAKATVAELKYNKNGWVSLEFDDNSLDALKAEELLKGKFYTDGCGNNVPYAAALAVIGRSNYNNQEMGTMGDYYVTYAQMKTMIGLGWDIENHSLYHEPTGNYNNGTDWAKNISEMNALILQKINYNMNGAVVPVNYSGFPTAAKNFGYLFSSSESTFDNLAPGLGDYQKVASFNLAPLTFSAFNRIFNDDWSKMETDVKSATATLITRKNSYFRLGSHKVNINNLQNILDNFSSVTKDNILFLSTREIMEYRVMAKLPITYKTEANILKVVIDPKTLPDRFRWRDLSFIVTSKAKITNIKNLNGIDKATFNPETGLVNIFKQKTIWQ